MQLLIELPARETQLAFNRERWEKVLADPELAVWEGRIETNRHGEIIMTPPPTGSHSNLQGRITVLLHECLGGRALPECPVSTIDGVRAADVGWYSEGRYQEVAGQNAFEKAPEICVEVASPSNSAAELDEKKHLSFDAGAEEVWLCDAAGAIRFYLKSSATEPANRSVLCPDFPGEIPG